MHDDVYKGLREKGIVTWDGQNDIKAIYKHHINQALSIKIDEIFPCTAGLSALDLGTGTGTAALYLASKGFTSTGYDISKEAIEMAKENARNLEVECDFQVKDICEYSDSEAFDLVVDSSFLHCIVHNEERSNIYSAIRKVLKKNAYFFIHTMVQSDDMSDMLSKDYLLFEDDILWSTGKESWDMDWQQINGKRVFPHRKILTIDKLEEEITANNFIIMDRKINLQEKSPSTYIAWLKLKT